MESPVASERWRQCIYWQTWRGPCGQYHVLAIVDIECCSTHNTLRMVLVAPERCFGRGNNVYVLRTSVTRLVVNGGKRPRGSVGRAENATQGQREMNSV